MFAYLFFLDKQVGYALAAFFLASEPISFKISHNFNGDFNSRSKCYKVEVSEAETSPQNVTEVSAQQNQNQLSENTENDLLFFQSQDIEQLISSCIATPDAENQFHNLNSVQQDLPDLNTLLSSIQANQEQESMFTNQDQEVSELEFPDVMDLLSLGEVDEIPDIGELLLALNWFAC